MKEFLSREGVPFVTRDVDEDDAAYRELIDRGFRSVPVTVIGEVSIRGYDPAALSAVLAARRREDGP